MLKITSPIALDKKAVSHPNLSELLSSEDLTNIGNWVWDNYDADCFSRVAWERRTNAAMDLAMQVQKDKSFPWQGCSNVAFPLVTIAALQFHSRAYPAIVNGRSVVQCRVIGEDKEGNLTKRADRISKHMSWQLLEQDEEWEEDTDRALLTLPIVGTVFKKTFFDPSKGHNVSKLVMARDLVLNYYAKSVNSCPFKTEIIPLFHNDIYERVMRGEYCDCLEEGWYLGGAQPSENQTNQYAADKDNRAGLTPPTPSDRTPFTVLEAHCWMDLDCDGYEEPYIATIEEGSKQVLRIVARFNREEDIERNNAGRIIRITATEYYTKIPFVPSPDGSILDIGFGILLGPLNESVNTSINQLFDSGTMNNTAGGFLARGAKIRGGIYQFSPFSWNRVDSTGDDLRKSIVPLPVREPSAVLFNLLSLLIDYTNRIAGVTDAMVGQNPGQNTPAETHRTMLEQGQKIYSAIFKRVWRAMKREFKKLYILNSLHLPSKFVFGDGTSFVYQEDYTGSSSAVVPVADPTIVSDNARFAQASLLKAAAVTNPGYDSDAVERRYLRALQIDDVDIIYPGLANKPPPGPDLKVQIQMLKNEQAAMELEFKKMSFIATLQEQRRLNTAKIVELNAKAFNLTEKAKGVDVANRINAFNATINALREQNTQLSSQIDLFTRSTENESIVGQPVAETGNLLEGPVSGMERPPDLEANVPMGGEAAGVTEGTVGNGSLLGFEQ